VFHSVREEAYEICIADSFAQDPRGIALLKALESARYRRTLDDLPGYAARHTGEWRRIQAGESDTPHP
jgi:molybdate-binding protein